MRTFLSRFIASRDAKSLHFRIGTLASMLVIECIAFYLWWPATDIRDPYFFLYLSAVLEVGVLPVMAVFLLFFVFKTIREESEALLVLTLGPMIAVVFVGFIPVGVLDFLGKNTDAWDMPYLFGVLVLGFISSHGVFFWWVIQKAKRAVSV